MFRRRADVEALQQMQSHSTLYSSPFSSSVESDSDLYNSRRVTYDANVLSSRLPAEESDGRGAANLLMAD